MPEVVPDYSFFGRPACQDLVSWLDALCGAPYLNADASLLSPPSTLSVSRIESEWDVSARTELVCVKVVTGWLLHRISSETADVPSVLLATDSSLADRLGCAIGGCGNLSFIYNWSHPLLTPGQPYDVRALKDAFQDSVTPVQCRFVPIGGDTASSMEAFILGHIEMETHACCMFEAAVEAHCQLTAKKNCAVALKSASRHAHGMLSIFMRWFKDNNIKHDHWSTIVDILKLPESIDAAGINGVQSTSVYLLGEMLGVGAPAHAANQKLTKLLARTPFVPHQRAVVNYFQKNRNLIKNYIDSAESSEEECVAYNKLVKVAVNWRGAHRTRVLKYVSASSTDGKSYVTSTESDTSTKQLAEQFDSRMHEFGSLIVPSKL